MQRETSAGPINIVSDDQLNTIVARYPQTLPTLQHFGLDTCCGGSLPLQIAAQHHGLDIQVLIEALTRAAQGDQE